MIDFLPSIFLVFLLLIVGVIIFVSIKLNSSINKLSITLDKVISFLEQNNKKNS